MAPLPNYQHLTYVPVTVRTRWEIWIDWILPPILTPAGMRFDDDYYERILFHVFGIGGPHSDYNHALTLWDRILNLRDAIWERWTDTRQRWTERRKRWTPKWLSRRRSQQPYAVLADSQDIESQYPSSLVTDERTCLLPPRTLHPINLPRNDKYLHPLPSSMSPPRTPSSPQRPALSAPKKNNFIKKFKVWKSKSKTVRFSVDDDDEWVFSRAAWEPRGCTRPNYANLPASDDSLQDPPYPTPASSFQGPRYVYVTV